MTLCLCSQLNLLHQHRERRQMLTLHSSTHSICTRAASAGLFCLRSMRITSHIFIYEQAQPITIGLQSCRHKLGPTQQETTLRHTHTQISSHKCTLKHIDTQDTNRLGLEKQISQIAPLQFVVWFSSLGLSVLFCF